LFCPPIGHRQERGDYQESWQPVAISEQDYNDACEMAKKVTTVLTGAGLWGVEFFLTGKGVYFSELSPRPHDTGMVTLAGTQNLSEFELHARAILGLPIPEIKLERAGASAVILANKSLEKFTITGIEKALEQTNTDIRVFGKPTTRPYRRMAVALVYDAVGADVNELRKKAKAAANNISIQ
jgi:phosphoribosylglycinamide formyltransferase 2